MWEPLFLCLLSTLLTTGNALLCEVCESIGDSCSGPLQPCAISEGTCVKFGTTVRLRSISFNYTSKSCLEPASCEPGPFTITFPYNVTYQTNVSCCDSDGCNAGAIPVPARSLVANGRQCPSCLAAVTDGCKDMKPLHCTGMEDHCLDISGTLTVGNMSISNALAGCSTLGSSILREGLKKFTQHVSVVLTRSQHSLALNIGEDTENP